MADYNIADLPLEMLVEIFTYLTPSDRREASLVSLQFFDAAQHPRFVNDRHLHFSYCELAENVAPVSVFLQSTRAFHALTLSYFDCDKPIDTFWEKIGKSVKYLEFNQFCDFGIYLPATLNRFTALETLKIDTDFDFGTQECILPNLENLILSFNIHGSYSNTNNHARHYENLIKSMPKLKNIELIVYSGSYDALIQFLVIYPSKIKAITFQMLPDDSPALVNTLKCIMKLRKIQLEKLCITYFNNWLLLDEFLEKQPSLKHLELGTNVFPSREYPSIKKFEVSINKSVNSFESLKFLENLENLIILGSYGESNCFYGHKRIPCKSLIELQLLDLKDRLCLSCFDAMLSSYPNLSNFYAYGTQLDNEHIKLLLLHAPKLRKMNILEHTQVTEEFICSTPSITNLGLLEKLDLSGAFCLPNKALLQWPKMINLRDIGFGKIFDVNSDGMSKFLKQCPSIETFTIHETFRLTNDIIRLLFSNLSRLKHFRIYNEFEEQAVDRKDRPWLDLTKGCRELQSIRIIDPNNKVDMKYELFKRVPSLKVIYHAKHDLMTRASCFSIANYVRLIGIPYSKLGKLQEIIEKYSDDEFEFGIVPM
uniref:CSON006871 protein n=1 Tax=Culicoides sonorensis TaxID=179676 RepID=A0A336LWR0_CULSO